MERLDTDATGLAELVRRGEVHPRELVDAAIAAIEAQDGAINAVVQRRFEQARDEAGGPLPDGPFRGVPFLLKDYGAEVAGEPYHEGMAFLRDRGWRAEADSALAAAFRAAGLVNLGRTNLPELALMGTTEPAAAGVTHNPWALDRSPGGSSGGSAAAVAAGMVPAAHANDIAGSIRIPAAHCGLVGLKPSRGRVASGPRADPPFGFFSEGVVTRSVRDTAGLLDAITAPAQGSYWPPPPLAGPLVGEVGKDPGRLRVALCVAAPTGAEVDAGCADAARTAAALLEAQGHDVREAAPPALFEPDLFAGARVVLAVAAAQALDGWAAQTGVADRRGRRRADHVGRGDHRARGHGSGARRVDGPPAAARPRHHRVVGGRGHRPPRHAHDGRAAHPARRLPAGLRGRPGERVHPPVQRDRAARAVAPARLAGRRAAAGRAAHRAARPGGRARPRRRAARAGRALVGPPPAAPHRPEPAPHGRSGRAAARAGDGNPF